MPPTHDNFVKYVQPDGFLWHSDFKYFHFGRDSAPDSAAGAYHAPEAPQSAGEG